MRALHILGGLGLAAIAWGAACAVHPSGDCGDDLECASGDDDGSADGATGDGSKHDGSADGSADSGDATVSDGGDASHDGALDAPIDAPPPCDPAKGPATNPCVVSDATGVFVAPAANGGSDANGDGSKAKPYESIAKGLTAAITASKVLLVCNATYDERITISPSAAPIRVYGGLACPGGVADAGDAGDAGAAPWAYVSGARAIVSPQPNPSVPYVPNLPTLSIGAVTMSVDIVDMEFHSLDAVQAGESSFAAWVSGAKGAVTFTRVKLVAGKAQDGTNGQTGTNYVVGLDPTDPSIKGKTAVGTSGGVQQDCAGLCTAGKASTGGQGGQGTKNPTGGNAGDPSVAGSPASSDGEGGSAQSEAGACTNGHSGASALGAADGLGAIGYGLLAATAWSPAPGTAGVLGVVGQGGGGGGGSTSSSGGGGGGGGCGGCGGAPGQLGTGGGASVGLTIVGATSVSFTSSEVLAVRGGKGGNGSPGQAGQGGGSAGGGDSCGGGPGGTGGTGGAGGGGAGGLSVGILFHGTPPTVDTATTAKITTGAAGAAGVGGKPGVNDGKAGVSQAQLEIP